MGDTTLVQKLLVVIDRQMFALDYDFDPRMNTLANKFLTMLMADVRGLMTWDRDENPLVAMDATIEAHVPSVRKLSDPTNFMGFTLPVAVTVNHLRVMTYCGLAPSLVVPTWLASQLGKSPVLSSNNGTVIPLG